MMNYKYLILVLTGILGISTSLQARQYVGSTSGKRGAGGGTSIAANCNQPTSSEFLEINNVRALIQTGGDMWWDLVGQAQYEIPSGSGRTALFAGSLWLGGEDQSGQLKLAALRFRAQGTDFWTGPLSTTDAEITPETCNQYDEHFRTTRAEVSLFREWYNCNQDPDCDGQELFPGYQIPKSILEWPAHGDPSAPFNQDFQLAPFIDNNGDGVYNPQVDGDYPRYQLDGVEDCGSSRIVDIYGDENLWWVFNDKGNIHTETGGEAIGMEIRAQAFGFATNDEVNNMTFYNYELHNRSTFVLTNTYFGFFVDSDLGNAQDDYVGCDVSRGLGYAYNGDELDESAGGAVGYGTNPPAIGVDFFQGPFQDDDGKDNCLCLNDYDGAIADDGIPYTGLGVGYGDGIPDNERLGMRAFLYFNNGGGNVGDPQTAPEYYNYLRSFWRDNSRMVYGGRGTQNDFEAPLIEADFMFPGDSDPIGWGTGGTVREPWTEVTAGNAPADRRFVQSSGPFVLAPGAVNNVTVGVVWSRANSGGANASVSKLLVDDQKTQALFDNCFQLLDGPDAPNLEVVELDQEIILTVGNSATSNNYNESYAEADPFIIPPDSLSPQEALEYQTYKFQGYQIYQLADASVSASDIYDDTRARLVFQSDIKDDVEDLTNYIFNTEVEAEEALPRVVNAQNDGIIKSVRIDQDLFAEGDRTIVNHKTYYYMAIAYAHNNYKTYKQNSPDDLDGQKTPYLPSRRSATGPIPVTTAIPHKPSVKNNGTVLNSIYAQSVPVVKLEGLGNSGFNLDIPDSVANNILTGNTRTYIDYVMNQTPIQVQVVDPLSVRGGNYTVVFKDTSAAQDMTNSYWEVFDADTDSLLATSGSSIQIGSEEIVPGLGISIRTRQQAFPGDIDNTDNNGMLTSTIEFSDDSKAWLTGFGDNDGGQDSVLNWIRSGTADDDSSPANNDYDPDPDDFIDPNEDYENIIDRWWAPFRMSSPLAHNPSSNIRLVPSGTINHTGSGGLFQIARANSSYVLQYLNNVNLYITDDQDKWTRSPVIEAQDDPNLSIGGAFKMHLRQSPSVDKDGNPADTTNGGTISTDPNSASFIATTGMGWFPGYAIDIETGERLNIAFAEDSYLISENGADMVWNPTSTETEGAFGGDRRYGGKHFIYIFRNNIVEENATAFPYFLEENPSARMPAYDAGQFIVDKLSVGARDEIQQVWRACNWVAYPRLVLGRSILETDVTVKLRVTSPFRRHSTLTETKSVGDQLENGVQYLVEAGPVLYNDSVYVRGTVIYGTGDELEYTPVFRGTNPTPILNEDTANIVRQTLNGGLPVYQFSLNGLEPSTNIKSVADDALEIINVVPNPYYAYSTYEVDKIDNRVKIVNLPERATIKIYTMNGILVREFTKDDPNITSIDWDLKNHARIPIASGVYLIHVDVPGVGEQVIKWFAVMRPVDLDSF